LVHALPVATVDTEEEVREIQAHFCRLNPGVRNDTDTSGEYVWNNWTVLENHEATKALKAMDEVSEAIEKFRSEKDA